MCWSCIVLLLCHTRTLAHALAVEIFTWTLSDARVAYVRTTCAVFTFIIYNIISDRYNTIVQKKRNAVCNINNIEKKNVIYLNIFKNKKTFFYFVVSGTAALYIQYVTETCARSYRRNRDPSTR